MLVRFLIVIATSFCACSSISNNPLPSKIQGIKVTETLPLISKEGKLIGYDTVFTNIYYYKNQVLYNSSYTFDSIVNDRLVKHETRNSYFVYTKQKKYGLFYDSSKLIFAKKKLVDSIIKEEWSSKISFRPIFSESSIQLISRQNKSQDSILHETYFFRGIKDTGMSGTFNVWFSSELNGIDYTLSKELDSMNKLKAYKIRIINNPHYLKEYNFTLEKINQAFDIEKIFTFNEVEILNYFYREQESNK